MFKFFHHLLNPHCPDCEHQLECPSCEMLQKQLDIANYEKRQFLEAILNASKPRVEVTNTPPDIKLNEVVNKFTPWRVRQQQLEAEDRQKAIILKQKMNEMDAVEKSNETTKVKEEPTQEVDVEISELEKEMGLAEAEREANGNQI